MSERINDTFLSTDGVTTITSYWYIAEDPIAVMRLCHGMSEYLGRDGYDALGSFLSENGVTVCGHDYIGHGLSAGGKEDLGFFAEQGGVEMLLGDVEKMGRIAAERFPGVKQVLFGHSMGSLIAREYLAIHPGEVDAAIIMGTLGPIPVAGLAKFLAKTVCALKGSRGYSKMLHKLSFGSYLKRIPDAKSRNSWISTDEAIVEQYDADPLCGFMFTNRAMYDLIDVYSRVSEKSWADKLSQTTPILMLSGSEDPCGGYGDGVKEIQRRIGDAGVKDVTLKLYDGARHELLNEFCQAAVRKDIRDFIKEKLS